MVIDKVECFLLEVFGSTMEKTMSPTVFASPLVTKKRTLIKGKSSSPRNSLKITIKRNQLVEKDDNDSEDRIEPRSHKDNPEVVVDDDVKRKREEGDGWDFRILFNPNYLTIQNEQSRKSISSKYYHLPGALRKECEGSRKFKAHAPAIIEELFKNHVQSNVIHVHPTTTTSTETESSANFRVSKNLYLRWMRKSSRSSDCIALWEALQASSIEGEKKEMKKEQKSKRSKSGKGSSPKAFKKKDSPQTYVSKQQSQQQEWDAWEEENVIDEDVNASFRVIFYILVQLYYELTPNVVYSAA
ncbi:hypothetical protein Tco_1362037 [Tanacetum coccineum]